MTSFISRHVHIDLHIVMSLSCSSMHVWESYCGCKYVHVPLYSSIVCMHLSYCLLCIGKSCMHKAIIDNKLIA